jgi:predicted phosphodiesterase
VRTAIVSDLHLGARSGRDLAARRPIRDRLVEALAGSDRVVLLGDAVELRERPLSEALEVIRPFFEALGEATAGRRVVLVPGNHDHMLAEPWLAQWRLNGANPALEGEWAVEPGLGVAGRIAEWMPDTELSLSYPGLRLRPDVYAIHGHYLDLHLTIPRLEALAASLLGRITGRGRGCSSTGDYEAVLSPMYGLYHSLAQAASPEALERAGGLTRAVWSRASPGGSGRPLGRFLLGRVTIPGAVAVINRIGLGPFSPVISGEELRRSGLRAMCAVTDSLEIDAEHVIFGHTHRPGPLPGDDPAEWTRPGGGRLWNCGSWFHETSFLARGEASPYWPGSVIRLDDEGPPRVENALRGVVLSA